MNSIELVNLRKEYKDVIAVKDLNLEIEEGIIFGLLGVNGAGKSTTIKMISGLIKPTSGDVIIFGKKFIEHQSETLKHIMNVSPQETAIAPKLTAYENLEFIGELYGISKHDIKERINEIVKKLSLEKILKKKASTLSGGWQRRLSIAMALVTKPKILMLDEPTLGLDVLARRELWDVIKSLHGEVTIILTTHYLEEAEALSDKIAIMADGEVKALGSISELKTIGKDDNFENAFVNIVKGGNK